MTQQIQEKIIINDEEFVLLSRPLDTYLEKLSIKSKLKAYGSHCRRGYVGTWQILDNILYLVHIKYQFYEDDSELIIPLMPSGENCIADWYSGELRVPYGDKIYQDRYHYPLCEKEMIFRVVDGIIISQKTIKNEIPEIDDSIPEF